MEEGKAVRAAAAAAETNDINIVCEFNFNTGFILGAEAIATSSLPPKFFKKTWPISKDSCSKQEVAQVGF